MFSQKRYPEIYYVFVQLRLFVSFFLLILLVLLEDVIVIFSLIMCANNFPTVHLCVSQLPRTLYSLTMSGCLSIYGYLLPYRRLLVVCECILMIKRKQYNKLLKNKIILSPSPIVEFEERHFCCILFASTTVE